MQDLILVGVKFHRLSDYLASQFSPGQWMSNEDIRRMCRPLVEDKAMLGLNDVFRKAGLEKEKRGNINGWRRP